MREQKQNWLAHIQVDSLNFVKCTEWVFEEGKQLFFLLKDVYLFLIIPEENSIFYLPHSFIDTLFSSAVLASCSQPHPFFSTLPFFDILFCTLSGQCRWKSNYHNMPYIEVSLQEISKNTPRIRNAPLHQLIYHWFKERRALRMAILEDLSF